MRINVKAVILALVVLAVGAIFVLPYLDPGPGRDGLQGPGKPGDRAQSESGRQFAVTPHPAEKLQEAKEKGRPVFLEFYAVT